MFFGKIKTFKTLNSTLVKIMDRNFTTQKFEIKPFFAKFLAIQLNISFHRFTDIDQLN